jgi:hypothetical protein
VPNRTDPNHSRAHCSSFPTFQGMVKEFKKLKE